MQALAALVEWAVASGTTLRVACGTTAETPTLTDREALDVIRLVVRVGRGGAAFLLLPDARTRHREAVERGQAAAAIRGVNAILTANPYYNKPTQEGQYQHFRAIAELGAATGRVIYNIPGRTACNLEPATAARLAHDCPNLCAVKESSGSLEQMTGACSCAARNEGAGAGGRRHVALPAIAVGAAGLVSVASNVTPRRDADHPRRRAELSMAHRAGSAAPLLLPLLLANFWETSLGLVKHILVLNAPRHWGMVCLDGGPRRR